MAQRVLLALPAPWGSRASQAPSGAKESTAPRERWVLLACPAPRALRDHRACRGVAVPLDWGAPRVQLGWRGPLVPKETPVQRGSLASGDSWDRRDLGGLLACRVQKAPKERGAAEVLLEPRETWEPRETRVLMEHREQRGLQDRGVKQACRASPAPAGRQDPGDPRAKKARSARRG